MKVATVASAVLRALAVCAPVVLLDGAFSEVRAASFLSADIPAQPLAGALKEFADQTGFDLVYISGVVRDQRSSAVAAGLNTEKALSHMLRDTGLRFEYLTPHSLRILDIAPERSGTARSEGLPEVIVTANRRDETYQDVPVTVQVLSSATLSTLNLTTFDDFVGYLPGVTAHGIGPSQNNLYVRGLATGEFGNQAAGSNASFPSVAVYLDEQPVELPGRNLDVYAADLEQIEVLEGPQGTVGGAGAEAGELRYITNKPKLDVTEASVSAGYAVTAHGDPSGALQAIINVPLIAERMAARAVIYNERRGGYINNIAATFVRSNADRSIYYAGNQVPANSVIINNQPEVANGINPVTYSGMRVEGLYQFNDDWKALLTQSYQSMEADGVFSEEATNAFDVPQPALTAQLFNPSFDKDRFENTALTVEGRIGSLKLLYAGAFLVRNVEQVQDYTNYAHSGFYVDYYQCVNPGPTSAQAKCFSPSETWRDRERNTHLSQELRLATPDYWRVRGIGGIFYEDYHIFDQGDWYYLTAYPYFYPVGPPTGVFMYHGQVVCACHPGAQFVPYPVTLNDPNVRPLGDGYFNDITRGYQQRAAYASLDFDLIPAMLTVTAGTRYSSARTTEVGAIATSFGCAIAAGAPDPCIDHDYFVNLDAEGLRRTYSGFRSRANLAFRPRPQFLLYYTWSQGLRAGGFNRSFAPPSSSPLYYGGTPSDQPYQAQANANGGWRAPLAYAPDTLINNELGWKTAWWEGRLHFNGDVYLDEWRNAQIGEPDNRLLGSATINGSDYRIRGLESSLQARIIAGLTVEVGAAWTHSDLVKEAVFRWADGKPIDFNTLVSASGERLSNPEGTLGSSLAGAPGFQGDARARYEWTTARYHAFAQVGVSHQSHSLSSTDRLTLDIENQSIAYNLPAFTTYDAALAAGRGTWLVQLYGQNLSDTRAQLFANYDEGYKAVNINRPRTIGLRMTYGFGGS